MGRVARAALVFWGVVWISLGSAQDGLFEARLSTTPISLNEQASVTGAGNARAELDGRLLTVEGRFGGLQGPASAARLHVGAAIGVRGAPIHELEVEQGVSGVVSGAVELTRTEVQALRSGRIYIQIDSDAAPDGNLWGWLL